MRELLAQKEKMLREDSTVKSKTIIWFLRAYAEGTARQQQKYVPHRQESRRKDVEFNDERPEGLVL